MDCLRRSSRRPVDGRAALNFAEDDFAGLDIGVPYPPKSSSLIVKASLSLRTGICGSRSGGILMNGIRRFLLGDSDGRMVEEVATELGVDKGVRDEALDEDWRFKLGDCIWETAFRFKGDTGVPRSGSGDDEMCFFLGVDSSKRGTFPFTG
jgi:hypothetical protein